MVCIGGNYDAVGHQTAFPLTLNGRSDRTISTEYDHLGNATSIRQHGNAVDEIFAEFEHNANGLLTSVRRYEKDDDTINEIANSLYEYNANSAVTSITHNDSNGSQIVKHSYTYDETNNIVEYLNSIDGNTEYNYDFLGQLISADYANGSIADETYTYDENGNRITANGSNYTTGDNNELTSDGTWSYTYDAEGNRISKTNATNRELYTWDHRNRLTSVTQQEWDSTEQEWVTVQTIEYAYDYNNVWIRKVIGNNKTIFIPENYQTTVQIDNNVTTHHYLWTPNQQDKLLADTTTDGVLWSLTDHLGTIRDIIGSENAHLIYDAFGNLVSGTNPLLFGFTGKAFDSDTHLQNNINRWYDAAVGRWLSTDPIGFEGNDTNLYRYVRNLPTLLGDAWGQEPQWNKYPWPTIPEYLLNVERFPGGQTLPSAETIQGDSNCYVYVHCSPVVAWGIDIGTHCGLTIDYNGKIVRFDGSGGDINQIEVRYGNLGHNPQTRFGIKTQHDSKVCECLLAYPENFNIHRIPRKHMQGNSNWTLSCMEKKCGLKINWNMWGPPSFYAVPPCKKYELTYRLTMQGPYCENACTEYYDCP